MANISSQMQNVMQNPEIWNNLDQVLMQNLGGPGGAPGGNNNPGQDNLGDNNPQ